jgi:hypothetical protein
MNTNKQFAKSITPHAEKVMEIIRQATTPLSRADIASALGKRTLSPWDIAVLEMLEEQEMVEVESSVVQVKLSYRAVK